MGKTESAKKAVRQSEKRRLTNVKRKADLKTVIKKYKNLLLEGKRDEAAMMLPEVYKKLDKNAKNNVIKGNKASRLKSRLTKKLK